MQQYLNILAKQMYDIALVLNKNEGTEVDTIGLLKQCAGEVVEATEQAVKFLRLTYVTNGGTDFSIGLPRKTEELYKKYKQSLSSELADIVACALIVAGKEELDIQRAVTECLNKNREHAERGRECQKQI